MQDEINVFINFYYLQDAFNTIWWSLLKTFIMMVGEIDYGSIIVDSKDILSEGTGAPLVPIPHFTAIVVFLFCMLISVLLMNLLVSHSQMLYFPPPPSTQITLRLSVCPASR